MVTLSAFYLQNLDKAFAEDLLQFTAEKNDPPTNLLQVEHLSAQIFSSIDVEQMICLRLLLPRREVQIPNTFIKNDLRTTTGQKCLSEVI